MHYQKNSLRDNLCDPRAAAAAILAWFASSIPPSLHNIHLKHHFGLSSALFTFQKGSACQVQHCMFAILEEQSCSPCSQLNEAPLRDEQNIKNCLCSTEQNKSCSSNCTACSLLIWVLGLENNSLDGNAVGTDVQMSHTMLNKAVLY